MIDAGAIIAALDLMIVEAETRYHQLMTGRLAVKVVVDGHETEFNRASADALKAYIGDLQGRRAALLLGQPRSGAIGIVF